MLSENVQQLPTHFLGSQTHSPAQTPPRPAQTRCQVWSRCCTFLGSQQTRPTTCGLLKRVSNVLATPAPARTWKPNPHVGRVGTPVHREAHVGKSLAQDCCVLHVKVNQALHRPEALRLCRGVGALDGKDTETKLCETPEKPAWRCFPRTDKHASAPACAMLEAPLNTVVMMRLKSLMTGLPSA